MSAVPPLSGSVDGAVPFPITWRDSVCIAVCTVIAALLRLDFMRAGSYTIDADEAIVGLMGKHIMEGSALPVFYYGQHYMGSLEGILAAASFSVFGPSPLSLQLVPLVCSLILLPVMFLLAREIGGRWCAWATTILAAVPPAGLVVWSTKARGGFIEILLLGACALLVTCRWLKSGTLFIRYAALLGFLLGVGWWVNNQIIYFIAPISLFVLLYIAALFLSDRSMRSVIAVVGVGILAFLFGGSPYWIYNIKNGFPSLGMFGFASASEMIDHIAGLFSTALPILLGGKKFWDSSSEITARSIVCYLAFGTLLLLVLSTRVGSIARLCIGRIDQHRPIEMFFLFIAVSCAIFSVSTFGWLVQAPRYLLPVYVGLFPLCGVAIDVLRQRYGGRVALISLGVLVGLSLCSSYYPVQAVPGEPKPFVETRKEEHRTLCIQCMEILIVYVS